MTDATSSSIGYLILGYAGFLILTIVLILSCHWFRAKIVRLLSFIMRAYYYLKSVLLPEGGIVPDVTLCLEHNCPRREQCYRYTAKPDDRWQSYFTEKPCGDYMTCEEFWDNTDERK